MKAKMAVHGGAELERALKGFAPKVAKTQLRGALMSGARIVEKAVEANAPVRQPTGEERGLLGAGIERSFGVTYPGFLRDSIRRATLPRGEQSQPKATLTVAVGIGRAFWGMFLEFGTRFMPARPWFRPAWDATKTRAVEQIGKDLGRRIERLAAQEGATAKQVYKNIPRGRFGRFK